MDTRGEERPALDASRPSPVLVYDRVATNRRHSRLLAAGLGVLLFPLVVAIAALLLPLLVEVGTVLVMIVFRLDDS